VDLTRQTAPSATHPWTGSHAGPPVEHIQESTMQETFATDGPVSLYVEIGAGAVHVHAEDTTTSEIRVAGPQADQATVEERDGQIVVIGPQRHLGFFGLGGDLTVTARVPLGSDLATRLGSADLDVTGRMGAARLKSGSGEIRVQELTGDADVLSGSGDVEVGSAGGRLRAKTGSGDIRVGAAHGDVSLSSASGDVKVGPIASGVVRARTASGDVTVAVPAGTPVWTDISCLTGSVRSSLQSTGEPEQGQDYVEVRATTVSGDVLLSNV
jgi:hypothetical protein